MREAERLAFTANRGADDSLTAIEGVGEGMLATPQGWDSEALGGAPRVERIRVVSERV